MIPLDDNIILNSKHSDKLLARPITLSSNSVFGLFIKVISTEDML